MPEQQLCTFRLADLHVGIDIHRVQEVLADPQTTPVPLAPPAIAGLLNLRGQILTVIDARSRLGLPPSSAGPSSHVIVQAGAETISIVVDYVDEVVHLDTDTIDEVPTTVSDAIRACSTGAYHLDQDLLLVLDVVLLLGDIE